VQVAAAKKLPRDTGDQVKVGKPVKTPKAGDLVFWPGHVGIMFDSKSVINADGFYMQVVIEPLKEIVKRRGKVTAIRRL